MDITRFEYSNAMHLMLHFNFMHIDLDLVAKCQRIMVKVPHVYRILSIFQFECTRSFVPQEHRVYYMRYRGGKYMCGDMDKNTTWRKSTTRTER
jgi:hypothetical protein